VFGATDVEEHGTAYLLPFDTHQLVSRFLRCHKPRSFHQANNILWQKIKDSLKEYQINMKPSSLFLSLALTTTCQAFAPATKPLDLRAPRIPQMANNNNQLDLSEMAYQTLNSFSKFDPSKVANNIQPADGEKWGSRGETYFVVQAVLFVSIVFGGLPVIGDPLCNVLGPVLLLGGAALVLLSVVDLGSDSLTPFPKPVGTLKTEGIYAEVRHPIYAGLLAVALGLSILTNSADRLLLTGVLFYLLDVKTDKEEAFLLDEYGVDYEVYMVRPTLHKLLL